MTTISALARRFGLSRSTLLYYDRIGLLRPQGHRPGDYRHYDERDAARLEAICTYRRAGLPLREIARVLDGTKATLAHALRRRLEGLEREIEALRDQRRFILQVLGSDDGPDGGRRLDKAGWVALLRASGLSDDDMRRWHVTFERTEPGGHQEFLEFLSIEPAEIARIRAWSAETDDT